jgi:hypothetical protein
VSRAAGSGGVALLLAVLLGASSAQAGDGRVEISQASVTAAGGYPLVISQPGSYVLTGNLEVPEGESGISIATSDVTLDLNGFRITGGPGCDPDEGDGCPEEAIVTLGGQTGHRVTLRNGIIRGFNGTCVTLGDFAHLRDLDVSACRTGDGIFVGRQARILGNSVSSTGENGIRMLDASSTYAHNVVSDVGQGAPGRAIVGGRASAGNLCEDRSCTTDGRRRFYLTLTTHNGAQAPSACASGFHMASMWELIDPSQLSYDRSRGQTSDDSGLGPPSLVGGWIRTGGSNSFTSGEPGGAHCSSYTEPSLGTGTEVGLYPDWTPGGVSEDSRIPWWAGDLDSCALLRSVWCVED